MEECGAVEEEFYKKKADSKVAPTAEGPMTLGKIMKDLTHAEGPGCLMPVTGLANLARELKSDSRAAASVINGRWELAKAREDHLELCN